MERAMATVAFIAVAMLMAPMTPAQASISITVSVRPLSGATTVITILNDALVRDLKNSVDAALEIPASEQRHIYAGRQLEAVRTRISYNIQNGSTNNLVRHLGSARGD